MPAFQLTLAQLQNKIIIIVLLQLSILEAFCDVLLQVHLEEAADKFT